MNYSTLHSFIFFVYFCDILRSKSPLLHHGCGTAFLFKRRERGTTSSAASRDAKNSKVETSTTLHPHPFRYQLTPSPSYSSTPFLTTRSLRAIFATRENKQPRRQQTSSSKSYRTTKRKSQSLPYICFSPAFLPVFELFLFSPSTSTCAQQNSTSNSPTQATPLSLFNRPPSPQLPPLIFTPQPLLFFIYKTSSFLSNNSLSFKQLQSQTQSY